MWVEFESVFFEVHRIGMKTERGWSLSNKLLRNLSKTESLQPHVSFICEDVHVTRETVQEFLSVQVE